MENSNYKLAKSKNQIIEDALKNAEQVASASMADNKKSSTLHLKTKVDNKPIQKKVKIKHSQAYEFFHSLKDLEDSFIKYFEKISRLIGKKYHDEVDLFKQEIFKHIDKHHHNLKQHVDNASDNNVIKK